MKYFKGKVRDYPDTFIANLKHKIKIFLGSLPSFHGRKCKLLDTMKLNLSLDALLALNKVHNFSLDNVVCVWLTVFRNKNKQNSC